MVKLLKKNSDTPCRNLSHCSTPSRPIEKLNGMISELAKRFNYSVQYMDKLIGEEVRLRRISRDAQIYRISLLGWTQKEIGKLFGLGQSGVADIIAKSTSGLSDIQTQFYNKRKSVEELAKFYNLDAITARRHHPAGRRFLWFHRTGMGQLPGCAFEPPLEEENKRNETTDKLRHSRSRFVLHG